MARWLTSFLILVLCSIDTKTPAFQCAVSALSTTTPPTPPTSVVTGITLKLALDRQWAVADGPSSGPPQRFTSAASLDMVHRLRRDCQGVLVGRTTVERDDCSLTVRRVPLYQHQQQQPTRIILDPRLSLLSPPRTMETTTTSSSMATTKQQQQQQYYSIPKYQIFQDGFPTILYHAVPDFEASPLAAMLPDAVQCIYLPQQHAQNAAVATSSSSSSSSSSSFHLSPTAIWNHLQQHFGMTHILIEGGPTTALHFLPMVDRILLVRAPLTFPNEPVVSSHLSYSRLQDEFGFDFLGTTTTCGDDDDDDDDVVDTLEYWTRPHVKWPTSTLSDWP